MASGPEVPRLRPGTHPGPACPALWRLGPELRSWNRSFLASQFTSLHLSTPIWFLPVFLISGKGSNSQPHAPHSTHQQRLGDPCLPFTAPAWTRVPSSVAGTAPVACQPAFLPTQHTSARWSFQNTHQVVSLPAQTFLTSTPPPPRRSPSPFCGPQTCPLLLSGLPPCSLCSRPLCWSSHMVAFVPAVPTTCPSHHPTPTLRSHPLTSLRPALPLPRPFHPPEQPWFSPRHLVYSCVCLSLSFSSLNSSLGAGLLRPSLPALEGPSSCLWSKHSGCDMAQHLDSTALQETLSPRGRGGWCRVPSACSELSWGVPPTTGTLAQPLPRAHIACGPCPWCWASVAPRAWEHPSPTTRTPE